VKILDYPASGSLGGVTRTRGRAGQINRTKRIGIDAARSGRQHLIRSYFSWAASGWATLTPDIQAMWNAYASGAEHRDALGQSVRLTGMQSFVQAFVNCLNAGSFLVSYPNFAWPIPVATVVSFVAEAGGDLTLSVGGNGQGSDFVLVAFSRPLSPGISYCDHFSQVAVIAGNDHAAHDYLAVYEAKFGTLPTGRKVFVKVTPMSRYGRAGTPAIVSSVATTFVPVPVLHSSGGGSATLTWDWSAPDPLYWFIFYNYSDDLPYYPYGGPQAGSLRNAYGIPGGYWVYVQGGTALGSYTTLPSNHILAGIPS
jgi:hypothetical protein